MVDARVAVADGLGNVGEVEVDRPPAAGLEIDEPQPVLRAEHVAGVRLAVQQLFGGAGVDDRSSRSAVWRREVPGPRGKRGVRSRTRDGELGLRDPVGEVRRGTSSVRMPACSRSSARA